MKKINIVVTFVILAIMLFGSFSTEEVKSEENQPLVIDFELQDNTKVLLEDFLQKERISVEINNIPTIQAYAFDVIEKKDEWRIKTYLSNISYTYSVYNDETRQILPAKIYLVKNMRKLSKDREIVGLYTSSNNEIYLDIKHLPIAAIHHELFHSLQAYGNLPKEFTKNFDTLDECEAISEYSCTAVKEYQAETWAHAILEDRQTEKTRYIKTALFNLYLTEEYIRGK